MNSLTVLACLLGLVVLCESNCFLQLLEIKDINNLPKGCTAKDGTLHEFASEWVTKDCFACSCSFHGMHCCSKIPSAHSVHLPDQCELSVDKEACTFKVVMKSDNTKDCVF